METLRPALEYKTNRISNLLVGDNLLPKNMQSIFPIKLLLQL